MNKLECPQCGNSDLKKKGKERGKQVWKCKECGKRTVNPINNTSENLDLNTRKIIDRYKELNLDIPHPDFYNPKVIVENERLISKLNQNLKQSDLKNKYIEKELNSEKTKNMVFELLDKNKFSRSSIKIEPSVKNNNEACAVICLSDLHLEEDVDPVTVNGLNEYNPIIAEKRFKKLFQNALKLIRQQERDIPINNIILWLGGDLISGFIHPELMESNHLSPNKAILFADELITWGIDFLLEHTKCDLTVPTSHGNHGRSTEFSRIQTGADNSWEYLLYRNLERRYAKNKRIKFQVAEGYHNFVDIFDFKIRFHHGDSMRYGGGVGGITIPVNKSIAQWNQSISVDLDVFGHFHQLTFAGNFICNGSLIGYNAYALSIKASPETPQQAFFLIDKNRNRVTMRAPIFVD
jgi:hypothetical protein